MCSLIRAHQPGATIVVGGHISTMSDLDKQFDADIVVRREGARWFRIFLDEDPNRPIAPAIGRQFVWHIRQPLDTAAMAKAAGTLLGTHDFKAFEGTGSPRDHTIRTVTESSIAENGGGILTYDIEANGFLRFMVRNILGTLVEVGPGKISAQDIQKILQSKDRSRACATAPPQGLFLIGVTYQ